MHDLTDLKIVSLYKEGKENEAFTILIKKYQERIYWHIRRMVLVHEDADDIIQNTFIKAWKGLANFREDSNLYTWLYRIATNETITFINKNKNKLVSPEDVYEVLKAQEGDHYFTGNEIEIKLHQALNTLPEKQRLVFNMKYFDDMKYQEIADILGGTVGSLKASYFHAVTKIEAFIKSTDITISKNIE